MLHMGMSLCSKKAGWWNHLCGALSTHVVFSNKLTLIVSERLEAT